MRDAKLTATILRVIQRTADKQGNVTMIHLAERIAERLREGEIGSTGYEIRVERAARALFCTFLGDGLDWDFVADQLRDAARATLEAADAPIGGS